jgi:6-phosphofructokinase 1
LHFTDACRTCRQPLLAGADLPRFRIGLPDQLRPRNVTVAKKSGPFSI